MSDGQSESREFANVPDFMPARSLAKTETGLPCCPQCGAPVNAAWNGGAIFEYACGAQEDACVGLLIGCGRRPVVGKYWSELCPTNCPVCGVSNVGALYAQDCIRFSCGSKVAIATPGAVLGAVLKPCRQSGNETAEHARRALEAAAECKRLIENDELSIDDIPPRDPFREGLFPGGFISDPAAGRWDIFPAPAMEPITDPSAIVELQKLLGVYDE